MMFSNLADARKALSLLEEYKNPGSNCCVLQEYTVKSAIPVREGIAGPLTSKWPPYNSYPGGAVQWEMLLGRSVMLDETKSGWKSFLEPGKKVPL